MCYRQPYDRRDSVASMRRLSGVGRRTAGSKRPGRLTAKHAERGARGDVRLASRSLPRAEKPAKNFSGLAQRDAGHLKDSLERSIEF